MKDKIQVYGIQIYLTLKRQYFVAKINERKRGVFKKHGKVNF